MQVLHIGRPASRIQQIRRAAHFILSKGVTHIQIGFITQLGLERFVLQIEYAFASHPLSGF